MSYIWISYVTHTNTPCHTCQYVMSRMSTITSRAGSYRWQVLSKASFVVSVHRIPKLEILQRQAHHTMHYKCLPFSPNTIQPAFPCVPAPQNFSKVSSIMIVHSKFSSELPFENVYLFHQIQSDERSCASQPRLTMHRNYSRGTFDNRQESEH